MSSTPSSDASVANSAPASALPGPFESWLAYQQRDLKARLRKLAGRERLRVAQPFFRIDTEIDGVEVLWTSDVAFRQDPAFECDIYFNQGHEKDFAGLKYVRNTGQALIHATWLWDNHHLFAASMHASMLSDVTFCAHGYASGYLRNEISLDGGFIPLCPIFWEDREVEAASHVALFGVRSNQLYGGYNLYAEFPQRDILLKRVKEAVPDNHIFTTPHGTPPDQHPSYGLSRHDHLVELMHYKVSLCAPIGRDTPSRLFDTLLAGGIPLILGRPADLECIFTPVEMQSLPIIVVDEFDADALAQAYRHCLERFDQGGAEGVVRRSQFIREQHMPANRLALMVTRVRKLASEADDIGATAAA